MPKLDLDGKQRRHLRSLGHHLRPVLQIGQGGPTPGVTQALDRALFRHELVKVRVLESGSDLEVLAADLSEGTSSAHAQTLGRTLLFYRPHPKSPRIVLPGARPKKAGAGAGVP